METITFNPATDVQLPKSWHVVKEVPDGVAWRRDDGLQVIMSGAMELDGHRWIHVSVSRRNRLPNWRELMIVKTLFIGADRNVYQVLPDHRKHVNIHRYCLHLWATEFPDDDPLPDFTRGGNSI